MQLFSGKEYLKIDIANQFGLDKLTWDERLAWFDDNEHRLLELHNEAESPALYYAGVKAWKSVLKGLPIGYTVSLDATSSNLQILSVLTGDRSAAELCNVVDVGKRMDAYTAIYQMLLDELGGQATIERSAVKAAIMTAFFNSTNQPKKIFGEGSEMLALFYKTLATKTPAAWELNQFFLESWDPTATFHHWVMPDNFHVHVKVKDMLKESVVFLGEEYEITREVNAPTKQGRSLCANTVHSLDGMIVRELTRRCSYDPQWINLLWDLLTDQGTHFFQDEAKIEARRMVKNLWDHYQASGYLSARILDYLDGDTIEMVDQKIIRELLESLPEKPFTVFAVHDCFRCLPTYGNDLRRQYTLQLHLIAKSDMLSFLLSQILRTPMQVGKLDPTLADDILNSNYALS